MNNFIVIGSKGYKNLRLDNIIDSFSDNMRCNFALPNNNNGTLPKKQMLCIHLYEAVYFSDQRDIKNYIVRMRQYILEDTLHKFFNYYRTGKLQCYRQSNINYDSFLKSIGCPFSVNTNNKVASCGLTAIFENIKSKIKPFIVGFGLTLNDKLSYYANYTNKDSATVSLCHDQFVEINVSKWLHNNNYIDATMCTLEDELLPTFSCSIITIKPFIINLFLKEYGICIIKDFYPSKILDQLINEYHTVFKEQKNNISLCKDEYEISDLRIFNVEKYSKIIADHFSNNILFNSIEKNHTNLNYNKKTLINKVTYNKNQKMNSGGGWHRDSHDMQFKTIMYLSDVTEKNGCFQFITNSSKKYIEYAPPITKNSNTHFSDNTIEELLEKHDKCKIHDIVGKKGTIIIVDTTYIHRDKIIEEGERYAMTEYYI